MALTTRRLFAAQAIGYLFVVVRVQPRLTGKTSQHFVVDSSKVKNGQVHSSDHGAGRGQISGKRQATWQMKINPDHFD